jgi:hypothetical protein
VCEWQSIIPGVTNLPVASIVRAFDDALRFLPIRAILPSLMSISAFSSVPFAAVKTVALRIKTSAFDCADTSFSEIKFIEINNRKTVTFFIFFSSGKIGNVKF